MHEGSAHKVFPNITWRTQIVARKILAGSSASVAERPHEGTTRPMRSRRNNCSPRGQADQVALARAMLYDPRWGWHAAVELGATINDGPPSY